MSFSYYSAKLPVLLLLMKWLGVAALVAAMAGSASALFLFLLDWAQVTRNAHPQIIYALPIVGFLVGWLYLKWGVAVESGTNLLIDEICEPRHVMPLRMVPFILGGTVLSHVCGASVGREGTAVQMGGALAAQLARLLRLQQQDWSILLKAGVAAGFASVFGTPIAGAFFALEFVVVGRIRYEAIFACLVAAILANQVCEWWGAQHVHYALSHVPVFSIKLFAGVLFAGMCFGLVARVFATSTHWLGDVIKKYRAYAPLRPFAGGILVVLALVLLGAGRYSGLGIPVIQEAFLQPVPSYDFVAKMGLTITSLAAGFKGGEVTPLFFIGATLGNALAPLLDMNFAFLAALGFMAVFAGASNTPLASILMGIEMFGSSIAVYMALACVVSYLFGGNKGIYKSQQPGHRKQG